MLEEINKIKKDTDKIKQTTKSLVEEMREIDKKIAKKKIQRIFINRILERGIL